MISSGVWQAASYTMEKEKQGAMDDEAISPRPSRPPGD
jgi:hypothetical protein